MATNLYLIRYDAENDRARLVCSEPYGSEETARRVAAKIRRGELAERWGTCGIFPLVTGDGDWSSAEETLRGIHEARA